MMGIPHFKLRALLSALLLAAAQARSHSLLRGQSSLQVQNGTATVGNPNLKNQEVDETFSSDIDNDADPESVYEATLQDEQVKAELASHGAQDVDTPADGESSSVVTDVVKRNVDLESIYEATMKASQREVESILAKKAAEANMKQWQHAYMGKQSEAMVNTTAAAQPRVNHIKQLMDAIAHKSVKNVKTLTNPQAANVKKWLEAYTVPHASVQVHTKRASEEAKSPHLKKEVDVKADLNAVGQNSQSSIAQESYSNAEAMAMHATAKIVERGREAASEEGDDKEVGIVGEEAAETEEETDIKMQKQRKSSGNTGNEEEGDIEMMDDVGNAQEAEDGEENALGGAADGEEEAAADDAAAADDSAAEADTQSEDIDMEDSEDVDADAQQEEVEDEVEE